MKKITTLFFGLVLAPCVCLAKGAPDLVDSFQQQFDALLNVVVICPPGAPTRFVDNGDGTVCDHQTGLMWEMKNASDALTAINHIVQAVANGELTPGEATSMAGLVDTFRRAAETEDLERRIAELETKK